MDGINQAELARRLFEDSNDAFFIFDPDDNRILDANPTAERLTGTLRKQLLGTQLPDILRADDAHSVKELIRAHPSTGVFHSRDGFRLRSVENGNLTVNVSVSHFHSTPKPLGLFVVRDVTIRKPAEEASKRAIDQSEDQVQQRSAELPDANKPLEKDVTERSWLTRIYRGASVGLCCFDTQLRYVEINEWLAALNGLSVEEHLGRSVSELFPDLAVGIESQLRRVIETGEPIREGSVIAATAAKPGLRRSFQHNYDAVKSEDGTVVGIVCVVQDITERKRAEEALQKVHEELEHQVEQRTLQLQAANAQLRAEIEVRKAAEKSLRENHRRLQSSLNSTRTSCWELDIRAGGFALMLPTVPWLGFESDEMPHSRQRWQSLIHPDDVDISHKALQDHSQNRTSTYECEYRVRGKTGAWYWIFERGRVVEKDTDGTPLLIAGTISDITDRVKAEEKVRASEQMLRAVMDNAPVDMLTLDRGGKILFANRGLSGVVTKEQATGSVVYDYAPPETARQFRDAVNHVFQTGEAIEFDAPGPGKNGTVSWYTHRVAPIRQDGNVEQVLCVATDISERMQLEEVLKRSASNLQRAQQFAHIGSYELDIPSRSAVDWSEECFRILGLKSADGIPPRQQILEHIIHPDDRQRHIDIVEQAVSKGVGFDHGYRFFRPDGSMRWGHSRAEPRFDDAGKLVSFQGTLHDITDLKQAEQEVRVHSQQQAAVAQLGQRALAGIGLSELMDETVRLVAETLGVKYCNVLELLPGGEFVLLRAGVGWEDGLVGTAKVGTGANSQAGFTLLSDETVIVEDLRTEPRFDGPPLLRDHGVISGISVAIRGTDRPYGVLGAHVDRKRTFSENDIDFVQAIANVLADAIERKQVEEALRASELTSRTLLEGSPVCLKFIDLDSRLQYMSKAGQQQLKIPDIKPFYGCTFPPALYPESMRVIATEHLERAKTGEITSVELCVLDTEECELWFDTTFVPACDKDGRVESVIVASVNITDRKQAEISLRKSEQNLTDFFENAAVGLHWVGPDGIILRANKAELALVGYRREEYVGRSIADFHADEEVARDILGRFELQETLHDYEARLRCKDGSIKYVLINSNVLWEDGQFIHTRCFTRDITARKRLEDEAREHREQLAHVTRLSTMGEMAAGLAHELNQPLGAMSVLCYVGVQVLADAGSTDTGKLRGLFEKLAELSTRAGEIIRRLRDLVRKSEPVCSRVDVVEPIQEVLHLLESELRLSAVRVELQADHAKLVATMDVIQIQQVLVNLIRNALDAMSETEHDQRTLRVTTSRTADDLIEVAVRDTGTGVPVESADQVFDAFFSSKSEGMGMGLAISRTIIESHGGRLWMTPNSDRGVTFRFTVPLEKGESHGDGS